MKRADCVACVLGQYTVHVVHQVLLLAIFYMQYAALWHRICGALQAMTLCVQIDGNCAGVRLYPLCTHAHLYLLWLLFVKEGKDIVVATHSATPLHVFFNIT